jgi:hypothetical protein
MVLEHGIGKMKAPALGRSPELRGHRCVADASAPSGRKSDVLPRGEHNSSASPAVSRGQLWLGKA